MTVHYDTLQEAEDALRRKAAKELSRALDQAEWEEAQYGKTTETTRAKLAQARAFASQYGVTL